MEIKTVASKGSLLTQKEMDDMLTSIGGTAGSMLSTDQPKVIAWNTDLVPNDSAGRTYLQKHGLLAFVTVVIEKPMPVQDGAYSNGGMYYKTTGNNPTLTIDNQFENANYIIR